MPLAVIEAVDGESIAGMSDARRTLFKQRSRGKGVAGGKGSGDERVWVVHDAANESVLEMVSPSAAEKSVRKRREGRRIEEKNDIGICM